MVAAKITQQLNQMTKDLIVIKDQVLIMDVTVNLDVVRTEKLERKIKKEAIAVVNTQFMVVVMMNLHQKKILPDQIAVVPAVHMVKKIIL